MNRAALLLLSILLTVACAQRPDESAGSGVVAAQCAARIIVGFVAEPNADVLAQLARVAGARLEPGAAVTAKLRAFSLTAGGSEPECSAAMERLRHDPRVSSVDIDTRREQH